ncbi:hypothetical protein EQ845_18360 [Pseudomonas putida]|nr:hypothetical protein EQ845_18360 [Pseudomonas putida]
MRLSNKRPIIAIDRRHVYLYLSHATCGFFGETGQVPTVEVPRQRPRLSARPFFITARPDIATNFYPSFLSNLYERSKLLAGTSCYLRQMMSGLSKLTMIGELSVAIIDCAGPPLIVVMEPSALSSRCGQQGKMHVAQCITTVITLISGTARDER